MTLFIRAITMIIMTNIPTYDELVAEGRAVESGRAWRLGDIALKVVVHYREQTLQRYAEDIDVEYRTLLEYRRVATAYESSKRLEDLPWGVHAVLAAQPDRTTLVVALNPSTNAPWTVASAQAFVKQRRDEEEQHTRVLTDLLADTQNAVGSMFALAGRFERIELDDTWRERFTQPIDDLTRAMTGLYAIVHGDVDSELRTLLEGGQR